MRAAAQFMALASFVLYLALAQAQTTQETESFLKEPKYLDNVEIGSLFGTLEREFPHLARAYTLGKTVKDRDLNVVALTAAGNDLAAGDLLKPLVKVTANIHGDETLGRQMALYLAQYLTENYAKSQEVQQLLNSTEIHILPSCNPDGFAEAKMHKTMNAIGP